MKPVRIQLTRRFPFAPGVAYPWLTDFQDADAVSAGAVVKKRRVTTREAGRVVYEGETEMLGVKAWSVTEVSLSPPSRWHARVIEGPRVGSQTSYELRADGASGSVLTVTYDFVLRPKVRMLALRVLRPLVARQLERMWGGFDAEMRKDLAEPAIARTSAPRT